MKERAIIIKGLYVCIALKKGDQIGTIMKRKIVQPEFVELWFRILDNQFDNSLWLSLSQVDQDFLALCVHQAKIYNPEFQKALARSSRNLYDRMKLIEESIKAGNLNPMLKEEFENIIDRLSTSGQMTNIFATKLKKQLNRTFRDLEKSNRIEYQS